MGHCQEKLSLFSHMTPALESLIPLLIIWAFPHAPLPKGIWVLLVIKIAICSRFRLMLLEIMIIIYNTLSIIFHSISFITKYSVLPTFPCWIFYSFSLFISSTVSSTPRRRMSRVGKDVSSRDMRIERQAISDGGKATRYTDCFAVFPGSQGQCHLSSVGPLHEWSSQNGIHSLVWHYSSARSSVDMCISQKKNIYISCRTFFVVC